MKNVIKIVVVVVLVAIVAIVLFAGPIIKNSVNSVGPVALGVPVSVEDVDVSIVQGIVRLNNLKIGNVEGYDTENMFTMESMNIDIKMASLLSDKIVIKNIEIIGPELTYEQNLTGNNIGDLLDQLGGDTKEKTDDGKDEDKAEKPKAKEGGKKVVIDYFVLDDCQVKTSLPGMGGVAVPLPLPKLELRDIGKDSEDGATVIDVVGNIFGAIFAAVGDVVLGSAKLLGSGVKAVGTGVAVAGGAAVDGAAVVGGAAVDGVSAVGGAAVDGVSAVGGAAVGGVKALGKGVSGLFGGGNDDEAEDAKEEESLEQSAE